MDTHKLPPVRTLGILLAEHAQYMKARNTLTPGWLDPLAVVMQRVRSLPVPTAERFQRRETLARAIGIARPVTSEIFGEQNPDWSAGVTGFDPAPADPEQARDPFGESSSPGQVLPVDVRGQLQTALGGRHVDENVRVHDDEVSDAFVHRERAAAVTIGQDIFLRQGQFRPQDPEGMALLAHEMVHALNAMRPNIAWKRATVAGVHAEEREALAAEQQVRSSSLGGEGNPSSIAPTIWGDEIFPARQPAPERRSPAASQNQPAASPALQPMRAELGRETGYPPVVQQVSSAFVEEERQRALYRAFSRQVRSDFERGG